MSKPEFRLYICFVIAAVTVGFQFAFYTVKEEDGYVRVCVELTGNLARSVIVEMSTMEGTAEGRVMKGVLQCFMECI